tara:strand:- start:2363 stop:2623 length:261 start_codon:yes stop_codon:yes gene_type:complete
LPFILDKTKLDKTNKGDKPMSIDRLVFAIAGIFILLSLTLSQVHHENWLWFTAFVGVNMFQAAFTGFCPLAKILKAIGVNPGAAFN